MSGRTRQQGNGAAGGPGKCMKSLQMGVSVMFYFLTN
jgi:hypothetical protein